MKVKCDRCGTHNTLDLTIIRRPKETPIWHLEQRMRQRVPTRGVIWCGCDAARLRPKTTVSLGTPAIRGIAIDTRAAAGARDLPARQGEEAHRAYFFTLMSHHVSISARRLRLLFPGRIINRPRRNSATNLSFRRLHSGLIARDDDVERR